MTKKMKIGLLYLGLHNQLSKKFGEGSIITRKEFNIKTGKHFIMPKSLRPKVLKEMENANLIKRIDRDRLQILHVKINIEDNPQELYRVVGL